MSDDFDKVVGRIARRRAIAFFVPRFALIAFVCFGIWWLA